MASLRHSITGIQFNRIGLLLFLRYNKLIHVDSILDGIMRALIQSNGKEIEGLVFLLNHHLTTEELRTVVQHALPKIREWISNLSVRGNRTVMKHGEESALL